MAAAPLIQRKVQRQAQTVKAKQVKQPEKPSEPARVPHAAGFEAPRTIKDLRQAIVMKEILGPPAALR